MFTVQKRLLSCDQNLPCSKFFPQLKVKSKCVNRHKNAVFISQNFSSILLGFFCEHLPVSLYKKQLNIIVTLTAVDAVRKKKLCISNTKTNQSPATKNLCVNLPLNKFSERKISLLEALPRTIKTKLIN